MIVVTGSTITLYQGDTGPVTFEGLGTEYNYKCYFAIQNERRVFVGEELIEQSDFKDYVTFKLPAELTNKLTVPANKEYQDYFYGIKACKEDNEDTLFVEDGYFGSKNILRVYPKKAEGTING